MEDRVIEKMEESITKILDEGLRTDNLDYLYKLSKIKHMAKEDKQMYGNYGNYGRDEYGAYNNYGARRRDSRGRFMEGSYGERYRGDEHLDRIAGEYGRYMEDRSRYGASEETDKSFHYMVKALEDFVKVLYEEADTPQQKQMLNETLQRSMR